ncbi:hypothetical protein G7Y89_g1643 [Cudoniella acicularis]|uniref:PH domain-containing protein n=1 Tax=Cudoniella acicularis TaxID=354080 RepID=A0A8H4RVY5_9HELO|nr:hypothetical protein G7Y89_g1643 [Cudoniella acicularis]
MAEPVPPPALQQAGRPLSLIPVGLKEAALDSPTFRATAVHFSDQVEIIERWLEAYIKSIAKLVHDVSSLEETLNTFLLRSVPPANISEAVLDHDYTLLAMKRFGEGSREWWSQVLFGMKKMDSNVVEPIKAFMAGELRNFKDARRYLEHSQKTFDNTLARYVAQSKTKEPSSLREDAFQVHETRKAYLKASLDFCLLAPQLRYAIDRLLVRVSADQWREMKRSREINSVNLAKWGSEMDRVRGWSREMEAGEGVFRRELQMARKEIADATSQASKPSRELEDYNLSTVAFLGSKGPSTVNIPLQRKEGEISGKQGWLFLRTISGKPARTAWVRRWFYVKNGIFGWLVQGAQSGGVEESEKIGVLLCNVKPAVQEERRFCFEVKTKNQTILVQAETQGQLMEWLETFEVAKNKALQASANDNYSYPGGVDPAFAITPPSIPEFAAKTLDGHMPHASDDLNTSFDRVGTLPLPGTEIGNLASRSSFDVSSPRRSVTTREEGESSRDHAARIMQKLDLHRKGTMAQNDLPSTPSAVGSSGIASLISASHNILPVYSPSAISQMGPVKPQIMTPQSAESHTSTLAPNTLANPPAPTNLSKCAVIVSGERGIGIGRSDATGGMPSGIMANLWGSSNWGYINRLEREPKSTTPANRSMPPSPNIKPLEPSPKFAGDENRKPDSTLLEGIQSSTNISTEPAGTLTPVHASHRKAVSVDAEATRSQAFVPKPEVFPANYPLELKTQEAQFRMLFPNVPREEKLLLVFRATWNPNEQQEFPGRVYVTQNDIYFYSHHLGLVLISSASMDSIIEVTAAPGKDCDFIFLHLREHATEAAFSRITIKTFLEPLRLLQSRLNYLVDLKQSEDIMTLEETMSVLIKMENEDPTRSPSMESWEDVSVNTPIDDGTISGRTRKERDLRTTIHVERGLHLGRLDKEVTKFQLPSQPVVYEPKDMQRKVVERQFEISPKALFHVMFGDKSAVFQLLYHERRAQRIAQGPWVALEGGHMRRDFEFQIDYFDVFHRARQANVVDYQVIDIMNDHVCYVVSDMKTPWHLPHHKDFMLVSKIVITHVAKSKCKLAIYTKVDWSKTPTFSKGLVERQALDDSALDALDLADVIADQVRKLGPHSRTKKAIHIFGHVGHQTSISLFSATESANSKRPQIKQRTLTNMLLETIGSFGESAITSLMMWTFAAVRSIWKVASAHSVIIIALLMSVLANAFFTSRDTSDWWAERNAAKFMTRIGVGPNPMMSKAIYLKDLDDALTSLPTDLSEQYGSKCYDQFKEIANLTDLDSPYYTAGALLSETSTRSTARRLRRTRQHLGSYRHDLMVAMRVVNNIEREMMKAEWENWLLDENTRCKQVQVMLQEPRPSTSATKKRKGNNAQRVMEAKAKAKERASNMKELRRWHEEYCSSYNLKPFLSHAFSHGQLIVDSVPIPAPAGDSISSEGRSRASSNASSASEISSSSARSQPPPPEVESLQKEWKPIKMNPRDNPLGMSVYKLGGKDGKGAWFARRSVHEGLSFTKWKKGLENEFPETMKVRGGPGEGNIRGIGGERRVAYKNVEGVGKMEVYLLSAQFPGPTTPRDFVTMFLTSDQALSDKHGEVPRHFMVISRPCAHPDTPQRDGFIRGQYESVEFIREIPIKGGSKKSASTTNLLSAHGRKRSGSTMSRDAIIRNAKKNHSPPDSENGTIQERGSVSETDLSQPETRTRGHTVSFDKSRGWDAKGENMDVAKEEEECEDNPVEWIMITRSDPGGSVPRFMIERGTPGGIVSDASKFLDWACAMNLGDFENDESATECEEQSEKAEKHEHSHHHKHNHEKDLHNWQTNGHLAGIEEASTPTDEKFPSLEKSVDSSSQSNGGLYGMMAGAAGMAGGYIASYTPTMITDYLPRHTKEPAHEPTNGHTESAFRRDSVSSVSSESSVGSFASALDHYGTRESKDSDASQLTTTSEAATRAVAAQDKELQKLEDKKRKLDEKLSKAREMEMNKKSEDSAKEEEAKEVDKLERKKEKETKKAEERKRKVAEKDERVRLMRELEENKAQVNLLKKEKEILRAQVGELQAENTALAARVGRLGIQGEEVLREFRAEVGKGGRLRASSLKGLGRAPSFRSSTSVGSAEKDKEKENNPLTSQL